MVRHGVSPFLVWRHLHGGQPIAVAETLLSAMDPDERDRIDRMNREAEQEKAPDDPEQPVDAAMPSR